MKLKKYNEFLNEELTPVALDSEMEIEKDFTPLEVSDNVEDIKAEEEEEVEAGEYHGTLKMKELADKLGVSMEGNHLKYDGKEINFFSEDEKFHIDGKKFETVDDAFGYLTGE